MDKTQEHYEKDTKLNTDQPPLFIPFFLDFVPQYFFVSSDSFICSTMSCVVENAALLNMVFLYVHVSSAGGRCVDPCCKGCSSCFPLCPRDFLSRQRENYMRVYGFSLGRTSGESYFCSRKRVITLKRKSGL